ncbi:MAG: hypothetical protein R2761_06765 [Acidimicrobiales bacterium]
MARTLLVPFAAFALIRGLVELAVIDYADPASYRQDWGGPSLLGVLAIHSGPGLVGGVYLLSIWRSRRKPSPD